MNKLLAMVTGFALATASIPAISADPSPPPGSVGTSQAQPSKGAQEEKHAGIKQDVAEWETAIKEKARAINREMHQKLAEANKEMKTKTAQIRQEAKEKIAALKKEMHQKQGTAPKEEKAKNK
jgi:membrane-bound lytic murein transglycosylase